MLSWSVLEIHMDVTPEKYISICSDNQVALKALEAANTIPIGTYNSAKRC